MPVKNDVQDWCKRLARGYRSSDISLRLEGSCTDLAGSLGRSKQVENAELGDILWLYGVRGILTKPPCGLWG